MDLFRDNVADDAAAGDEGGEEVRRVLQMSQLEIPLVNS